MESKKIWQKKENMIFKKDKSPKMVVRKCLMCSIERKIKHPNRVCEECKRTETWRDAMLSY